MHGGWVDIARVCADSTAEVSRGCSLPGMGLRTKHNLTNWPLQEQYKSSSESLSHHSGSVIHFKYYHLNALLNHLLCFLWRMAFITQYLLCQCQCLARHIYHPFPTPPFHIPIFISAWTLYRANRDKVLNQLDPFPWLFWLWDIEHVKTLFPTHLCYWHKIT